MTAVHEERTASEPAASDFVAGEPLLNHRDDEIELIPPDSLTEIAAVTHETTTDDDPNVSAWGIYGVLPDNSIDNLADCPSKQVADAIASTLNHQYGRKAA